MVTTEATAPGGARTEKVGLPFDPDLFDHMVQHGVVIEVRQTSQCSMSASGSLAKRLHLLCLLIVHPLLAALPQLPCMYRTYHP